MLEIDAADVRSGTKQVFESAIAQIAIHGGTAEPKQGLSATEVAAHASHEIVCERLDRSRRLDVRAIDHACFLLGGKRVEHSHSPRSDLSRQLAGANDRCRGACLSELSAAQTLRSSSDSARIEYLLIAV